MFCVNDTVIYSCYGVCRVIEITDKKFGGQKEEYYTLQPIYDEKSMLFVPVNNEKLISKMKPVMSKDEIYELIKSMSGEESAWIDDERERKEKYREILSGGNRTDIIRMIKSIYEIKKKRRSEGKKLHVADEKFFRDAEKLINEEFAYVLGIDRREVVSFIYDTITGS